MTSADGSWGRGAEGARLFVLMWLWYTELKGRVDIPLLLEGKKQF
jgi:hypothetical protein